jgi:hypothetical protein
MLEDIGQASHLPLAVYAVACMTTLSVLATWSEGPGAPRYASSLFYGFIAIVVAGSLSILIATDGGELVSR